MAVMHTIQHSSSLKKGLSVTRICPGDVGFLRGNGAQVESAARIWCSLARTLEGLVTLAEWLILSGDRGGKLPVSSGIDDPMVSGMTGNSVDGLEHFRIWS